MVLVLGVTLCLLLLSFLFLKNYIIDYVHYKKHMAKLNGPKKTFLLGSIFELLCDYPTLFKKIRKFSRDYYPCYNLAVLGFESVNISGPDEFEAVASSIKNIEKSKIYLFMDRWLGEGLLNSTGSKWQTRRKILTPAFHFNILQDFVTIFNKEASQLAKNLKTLTGRSIDVVPIIAQFTLNSIAETSMGTVLDINNEDDKNYIYSVQQLGKIIVHRLLRPWLYPQTIHYYLTSLGFFEKRLLKTVHSFTNAIIDRRSQHFELIDDKELTEDYNYARRKKRAMLDLLINAKLGKGLIDNKGIQDEVNTFMFEGYDTTSTSICFTLMLLANYKKVQDTVYQEIVQVLGKNNTNPTLTELNDLKYMERVIKESLRLYPSVPFIARILEEDVLIKTGHILPKTASCQIHIFDIHRDPNHWPEPEKFDPDRFLPENCANRHPFSYVPFSAGPRNCIGQRFAVLEIKSALSSILSNFILEAVDTPNTLALVSDIVLRTADGSIRVKFIERE